MTLKHARKEIQHGPKHTVMLLEYIIIEASITPTAKCVSEHVLVIQSARGRDMFEQRN